MKHIGLIIPPDQPPEQIPRLAAEAEAEGISEVWLWEDCFAPGGMTAATAALATTSSLRVGVGLFPVPLRNVALTAMEIATLARMHPDRLLPAIGHGVQSWMGQADAKVRSPLTLLREHGEALRALLAGEELTVQGRYVALDAVQLRWPPPSVPLYIGGEGPKTLTLAGELGDGVVLTGGLPVEQVRTSVELAQAASSGPLEVVAFLSVPREVAVDDLRGRIAELSDVGVTRVAVSGPAPDKHQEATRSIAPLLRAVSRVV